MNRSDLWMDLEAAMGELTCKQRQALGPWLAGFTQEEIGERCGVGQAAICRRIERAIEAIRDVM